MGSILFNIIIMPLIIIIGYIFEGMNRLIGNSGLAIIAVSLVVNFLILPLYRRAEILQLQERDRQKIMEPWIRHIKKTFKGSEQYMMLSTYYRQMNYNPMYAVNGSLSLLLQIPFFIAAFSYLSNLNVLNNVSFLFINDLSKPDNLFYIGGHTLNVLPIAMTLFNCISGIIYTRGLPVRDKVQTYGLAAAFLVLLYKSPSGLVLYWTCNQIFSILKNVFLLKLKNPAQILSITIAAAGTALSTGLYFSGKATTGRRLAFIAIILIISIVQLLVFYHKRNQDSKIIDSGSELKALRKEKKPDISKGVFIISGILLTCIIGVLIPSALIADSPTEFVTPYFRTPISHIINTVSISAGFFLCWGGIYYYMLGKREKQLASAFYFVLTGIFLINYMFFGTKLGTITANLNFDNGVKFQSGEFLRNAIVLVFVCVIMIGLIRFSKSISRFLSIALLITIVFMSGVNIYGINKEISAIENKSNENIFDSKGQPNKVVKLSKNGKNVIVLMLDRAISGYIPYIFNENSKVKDQFRGFTYYPNTVTFGAHTVFGAPPLFGGYEYTPQSFNERKQMTNIQKHNESLEVLPVLFSQNGYSSAVYSPPFANYKWTSDLSIWEDFPDIKAYALDSAYNSMFLESADRNYIKEQNRKYFCYSLMKVMPVMLQGQLYDNGNYYSSYLKNDAFSEEFLDYYSVLNNLPNITEVADNSENNYLQMQNSITHAPRFLQLPDYSYSNIVDNSGLEDFSRFTLNGREIKMPDDLSLKHYHVNMSAYIELGNWFDYLRKEGVWDNTRIIIVSDHGYGMEQFEELKIDDELDAESLNSILLYKDFKSSKLKTSNEFMTVADVATLATKDIISDPKNPFTGNTINSDAKSKGIFVTTSHIYDPDVQGGDNVELKTDDGHWYSVSGNIWNKDNWKRVD